MISPSALHFNSRDHAQAANMQSDCITHDGGGQLTAEFSWGATDPAHKDHQEKMDGAFQTHPPPADRGCFLRWINMVSYDSLERKMEEEDKYIYDTFSMRSMQA